MLSNQALKPKSGTTSGPQNLHASIYDLNGNAIRIGQPKPVLRRTASGHLFQPHNQVIKGSEMMPPLPLTPDETQPTSLKELEWALTKQEQTHSCNRPVPTAPASTNQQAGFARSRDIHNCRGESEGHRCWVAGLSMFESSDSDNLPVTAKLVSNKEMKIPHTTNHADDIWMQIARELEHERRP
jgi:hypothetical protein